MQLERFTNSFESLNKLFGNKWFTRAALGASVVSAVTAIILFTRVDSIVNQDLYSFSLRYDLAWYNSYSIYTKALVVCTGFSAALSGVILASSFMTNPKTKQQQKSVNPELSASLIQEVEQPKTIEQPLIVEQAAILEKDNEEKLRTTKHKSEKTLTMPNECLSCGKIFSKPLVMLNFVNGKPKMVNTCPYCNMILEDVENPKMPDTEFEVADTEKQKANNQRTNR
jgi:hypothetical protein